MNGKEAADIVIMDNHHNHAIIYDKGNGKDWINIIPEEMWVKLFRYIDDPDDLKNLVAASLKFSGWLHPRKTAFLYPAVIRVLTQTGHILETSELLKCRLINKHSKQVVDSVLERVPDHFKSYPKKSFATRMKALVPTPEPIIPGFIEEIEEIEIPLMMMRLYEHSPANVRNIMDELRKTNENYDGTNSSPFPRRHLYLEQCHVITEDSFIERKQLAKDFLDIAGKYFWYFDMRTGYSNYLTLSAWYLGMVEFVRRMPNLRALLLHNPNGTFRCNHWEWKQLDRVIEDHPFPKLKHLSMLVIEEVPEMVTIAILSANREIPGLKMRKLGNAISLCRSVRSLSCVHAGFPLRSNAVGQWPLCQLQIDFSLHESLLHWSDVFTFFERYANTLTHLQVSLPVAWFYSKLEDARVLRLPNLKELNVAMHVFRGINFIVGLTALEKLHLTVTNPQHECHRCRKVYPARIDVNKYFEKFIESDLWQQIHTLRKVKVDVYNVEGELRQPIYDQSVSLEFYRHQLPGAKELNNKQTERKNKVDANINEVD